MDWLKKERKNQILASEKDPNSTTDIAPIYSPKHYIENALSENSQKALKSDLEHFKAWGGVLPATPDMIALYLTHYAGALSVATLKRRLASLSKIHDMMAEDNPVHSQIVKMTMRGIARRHGKPQDQVKPILKEDLITMINLMPSSIKGMRDRALLLIGFAAALRRSELVALKQSHIDYVDRGLVLTLVRSKTDQSGQGRKIAIPYARGKICPVKSLQDWQECIGDKEYFFPAITKGQVIKDGHMSDRALVDIIKHCAAKAGLDPKEYSGHSLRAGLATSAAMQGVSSHKIRQQTGHTSDAMLSRYIRDGDPYAS